MTRETAAGGHGVPLVCDLFDPASLRPLGDRAVPPQAIAAACEYLHRQPPRAWTHELVLRPVGGGDWTAPT